MARSRWPSCLKPTALHAYDEGVPFGRQVSAFLHVKNVQRKGGPQRDAICRPRHAAAHALALAPCLGRSPATSSSFVVEVPSSIGDTCEHRGLRSAIRSTIRLGAGVESGRSGNEAPPDASGVKFEALPDPAFVNKPFSALPPAGSTTPASQKTNRFPLDLLTVAWLVYLAVCAALLLRSLIGLGASIRLWLQSKPVDAAKQYGELGILATRSSSRISSPVNIGSGIILPSDYSEWPAEKLRAVLAHEGSHVRQRDFYLQLLAGFYTAITWFSPLGWWLKHKLSELSEAISDRAGLEESASSSAYAQLLLEFAALPRPTLTGVAMARSNNLSHRIDRLLNESSFRQGFTGNRRALVAALIVPAVLVLAASLVRVQAAATAKQTDSSQLALLSHDQLPSYSAVGGEPSPAPAQASGSDSGQAPGTAIAGSSAHACCAKLGPGAGGCAGAALSAR